MTTPAKPTAISQAGLANHFLIAMRALQGDYFSNTVTYIIEHSDEGAFGLVINRPTSLEFCDLFGDIDAADQCQLPVFDGGPVGTDRVFFLHTSDWTYEYTQSISEQISLTTSLDIVHDLVSGKRPKGILTILGYAGWDAGQLENELAENVWLISPATSDIMFNTPVESMPEAAAGLLGIDLHLISNNVGHG
jgi:putative transcriptional regulator